MIIKNKNKKLRNIIIVSVMGCLLIVGGVAALFIARANNDAATKKQITEHEQNKYVSGGVNYSPPSDADAAMNAEQEQKNKEREELDKLPAATTATVTISSLDQADSTIEVRGYISNLIESGGVCTATFTKSGSATVTTTSTAFGDAKTTQCGALDIPRNKFSSAGQWSVVISYKSAQASGSSSAMTIGIK